MLGDEKSRDLYWCKCTGGAPNEWRCISSSTCPNINYPGNYLTTGCSQKSF
jgi:hypothetical protein